MSPTRANTSTKRAGSDAHVEPGGRRRCADDWLATLAMAIALVLTTLAGGELGVRRSAASEPKPVEGGHHLRRQDQSNRYLLETTGCGVAMLDYDNDGRIDLFFVNGTTLEGFPKGRGTAAAPLPQQGRRLVRGRHRGRRPAQSVGLGTGGLRRRLRQRRQHRSVRDLLRPQPSVSQHRAGTVRGRHRPRRRGERVHALGHGLRVPRLRSRRAARPVRRELHRSRSRDGADTGFRRLSLEGRAGGLRAAGPQGWKERALPQPRRRHLCRRLGVVRHSQGERHLRTRRRHARLRQRRLDRHLRRQRLQSERALPQSSTTARSRTSASAPGAPTARTASRRPAWASASAISIATAGSTS